MTRILEKLLKLDLLVLIPSRNIPSGVREEIVKGFELLKRLKQPQLEKLIKKVAKEFESDLRSVSVKRLDFRMMSRLRKFVFVCDIGHVFDDSLVRDESGLDEVAELVAVKSGAIGAWRGGGEVVGPR